MGELFPMLFFIYLGVPQNLSSFQMLIIALFTDIAPSLSLIMEKPERNLLKQQPRTRKDHLVDWKFIIQAYLFMGVLAVFFSQLMFFVYMSYYAGLKPADIFFSFDNLSQAGFKHLTKEQIDEFYKVGQTITFVSIVYFQIFGNLMATRTNEKSLLSHSPIKKASRNLYLFGAQILSLTIMFFIIYVPFCNSIFQTRPIPAEFFFIPFLFCAITVLVDELRKLLVRKKLFYFHLFGW